MANREVKENPGYLRIATEEAFATRDFLDRLKALALSGDLDDPAFNEMYKFYLSRGSERSIIIEDGLVDIGSKRLADMDRAGIDIAVLSLTAPGVHVFEKDLAASLARDYNDELAEACNRHPDRFVGLAAIAPQDPTAAAREIERSTQKHGFRGVILNSHVNGDYLDDEKYWPIFESVESCSVPIYLHPSYMSSALYKPFFEKGLDGAIYGFGVETGLHALRLIVSGLFDRFPKMQMVLGHMGEALPFWMYRIDYMYQATLKSGRYKNFVKLQKKPSEYLKSNFYITNSGVAFPEAIKFSQDVLGVERVLYAMDYPYQFEISEVNILDNMSMTPETKKMFFETNARKLFKI